MLRSFALVAVGSLAVAACGCERRAPQTGAALPALKLTNLPAEMTVKQRSTTVVPGSEGQLILTVDDITRGQVMASLATVTGEAVLPSRSMSADEDATFKFGGSSYSLTLNELNNALVGEDFASFIVSDTSGAALNEEDKIEQLIAAIAELQGATFIRNGAAHTAAEAADHLRMKWRAAGDGIVTAEQFIEAIGSKSSTSGEPYQIRMADGEAMEAGEYLRNRLGEINEAE
jgi:Family of unknown function (DUF5329)